MVEGSFWAAGHSIRMLVLPGGTSPAQLQVRRREFTTESSRIQWGQLVPGFWSVRQRDNVVTDLTRLRSHRGSKGTNDQGVAASLQLEPARWYTTRADRRVNLCMCH